MISVELVYDRDCPNAKAARANLLRAFAQAKLPAKWAEWERTAPATPERLRGYGSPTVLVNGEDLGGAPPGGSPMCRMYPSPDGALTGVPPVELIAAALARAKAAAGAPEPQGTEIRGWFRRNVVSAPAIGLALLPKLACPACWPAYAGLLSSLGLGALASSRYLLPLTAAFLAVSVGALLWKAERRHGYGPFLVGVAAAATVLIGKFLFDSNPLLYAGVALLIGASLWNSWPVRAAASPCPACAPAAGGATSSSAENPTV